MATNEQIKEFIKLFSRLAINECNRRISAGLPFVLPSVCMAQSALECDWGQAGIMKKANAFFGIKAGGSWTGKIYVADTWEVAENGETYNTVANFRAYDSPAESMADYYNITCSLSRYSKSWSYGADKSQWLTAKETITAIHAGGYATDNLYVQKIMNTINGRDLTQFDDLITGEGVLPNDYVNAFTTANLKQGTLITADSGRTIVNDTTNTQNVALNWENAFTITENTPFIISLPETLELSFATLYEDTATISTTRYQNGSTFNPAVLGAKYGFILHNIDGTPLTLADLEDVEISINSQFQLPGADEIGISAIAFFVKIE